MSFKKSIQKKERSKWKTNADNVDNDICNLEKNIMIKLDFSMYSIYLTTSFRAHVPAKAYTSKFPYPV